MKVRTIAALALCGVLLAGCQTAATSPGPPVKQTVKRQLTPDEIAAVQKGVRESLKDPDSARFGGMVAAQEGDDHSWVCGLVNAKNSFGGYTGDQPFMGMLTHLKAGDKVLRLFSVTSMGGTDTDVAVTTEMCRRYGVL